MAGGKTHPALNALMDEAVERQVFPAGTLLVNRGPQRLHLSAHGTTSLVPRGVPATIDTIYDLASLTKVLAVTPLIVDLVDRGKLALEDYVSRFVPAFKGAGRGRVTIGQLLEHSSGLAAWRAYFEEIAACGGGELVCTLAGRDAVRSMLTAEKLGTKPGREALYSDLGFMLLDWVIEAISGKTLDVLFKRRIASRLELDELFFIDLKNRRKANRARQGRTFAASERCPWRGRTLLGEVHDDNAYVMGGVSGHAGLFGTAAAVARLADAWLAAYRGAPSIFDRQLVRRFSRRSRIAGSTRALGFDTPSAKSSQAGNLVNRDSIGHMGFTGTSLWIDLRRELIIVLLTNRVHLGRGNDMIRKFRPRLHDAVVEVFGG